MANDIFGQFLGGLQAGQDQRRQRTIADLMPKAMSGDQSAVAQVSGVDPRLGMQLEDRAQRQSAADHEQKMGQLELAARAWRSAPPEMRQQLYPSIAELTESVLPQFAGKIPREYSPQYEANIDKFLSGFAGEQDNTPASIRELQMLQANPELAELDMRRRTAGFERPQLIQTDQGYAWATPQGATPLNYGGQPQAPADLDQSQVQNALAMLAGGPGVQMTSGLRTPERNRAVGGVPNSQHLRGTAGDYVVPQAQKAQFMQQAEAAGLHAIDEGDHVHVQARGRVMPQQKQPASSDFERRIAMAQSMGATPEQLKQMVIGETGGGKPSATQIKLANTAKQKLIDLEALERQLQTVESAFSKLKGTYSAGPGGSFLPTEDGRRFDAAVSLLKGQVRKLTRTPGEGAMSDYESKLAELANPSRGEYEQVTDDQIQQLRALVETSRQGYEALLQDAGGNSANLPGNKPADSGTNAQGWSIRVKP